MNVHVVRLLICFTALWVGCAPRVVILSPGPIPMSSSLARIEGPAAWSLWVAEARDDRPPDKAGQRLGTLYTRFEKAAQAAFLDQDPEEYLRVQLSRYLLHRGMEASGEQAASVLLGVDVLEFALVEDPGAVLDEIKVRVAYRVRFADPSGQDLGRVALEGVAQVKSPRDSAKQAEKAFREALADTFEALVRSEVFQRVLQEPQG